MNITVLVLTNPDVNRKRMRQLFCYMTLSLFSLFYIKSFRIFKLTQVRCSKRTEDNIISTIAFQISETLMRCAKIKFLIQNI